MLPSFEGESFDKPNNRGVGCDCECEGMCVVCQCAYEHVYVRIGSCVLYVSEYALCLSVCCIFVFCCEFKCVMSVFRG